MRNLLRLLDEIGVVRRLLPRSFFCRWLFGLIITFPLVLWKRSLGPVDDFLGSKFQIRFHGQQLQLEGASFGIVREIFGRQVYAESNELNHARCIVDLGANCGIFTLYALLSSPRAMVHAVEPQPKLVSAFQSNLALNHLAERAVIHNSIIGCPHDKWSASFVKTHPQVIQCDVGSLIVSLGGCDFLKCDIEGAEFQLFTSDAKWLSLVRQIALEYHGQPHDGIKLGHIISRHGFQVTRKDHGPFGYLECRRN